MPSRKRAKELATRSPYLWLGLGLTLAGAILAPVFYFIVESAPLSAAGLSFIMLGLTCIALANTRPPISPEASQMMIRAGMENIAALLEELGLSSKAIYLPHSLRDGRSQALVPLRQDAGSIQIRDKIPGRLIVRYGRDPGDLGIAITTPGSICVEGLGAKPGATAAEIEAALSQILVGMLDIASSVSVNAADGKVSVEVSNPKLSYQNIWFYRSLGSPMASVAAAVASEAFDRPVIVTRDDNYKGKSVIELEVLP
ncbi:MAG: hypothetical protein HY669_01800 [Chloroflexi bacterium]|nr:hypothetical protein [Chloroflexota bacterium]